MAGMRKCHDADSGPGEALQLLVKAGLAQLTPSHMKGVSMKKRQPLAGCLLAIAGMFFCHAAQA